MTDSDAPREPAPPSSREPLWIEVWSRHALLEEDAVALQKHFSATDSDLTVDEIRQAIAWGAEQAEAILTKRRSLRARAAISIAARRKLVWGEIRRLQREVQQHGGLQETTRTYGADGELKSTRIRTRNATTALMAAERNLAEVDRFAAAIDGILAPHDDRDGIDLIEFDMGDFFDSMYETPEEGRRLFPQDDDGYVLPRGAEKANGSGLSHPMLGDLAGGLGLPEPRNGDGAGDPSPSPPE